MTQVLPTRPAGAAPIVLDSWRSEPAGTGLRLTATLDVRGDDPHLRGHFPGLPVLPGVFVIDALCRLMRHALGDGGGLPALRTLRSVRFFRPLLDGDRLVLEADVDTTGTGFVVAAAGRLPDGTITARIRAEFTGGH